MNTDEKKCVKNFYLKVNCSAYTANIYSQSAVEVQLIQCKVYSVNCNSAAVMVYCLFGRIRSELDWMSKVQRKYYTWNFGQKRKKVLYFLWKYYLQCTLALQKKKNYDEKMMVFWTFSRSFQSCSNSPIALLFSVGIVVYILVMIYYYPVSCLMIWSVFYIKKSRRSLRNRGERENSKLKLQFFCHNQTRRTRYLFWHWQNGRPFNFTMPDFNRLS